MYPTIRSARVAGMFGAALAAIAVVVASPTMARRLDTAEYLTERELTDATGNTQFLMLNPNVNPFPCSEANKGSMPGQNDCLWDASSHVQCVVCDQEFGQRVPVTQGNTKVISGVHVCGGAKNLGICDYNASLMEYYCNDTNPINDGVCSNGATQWYNQ